MKFKELIAKVDATQALSIKVPVFLFLLALLILSVIFNFALVPILPKLGFLSNALGLIVGVAIAVKYFHKKHGRTFNLVEYRRFVKWSVIVSACSVIAFTVPMLIIAVNNQGSSLASFSLSPISLMEWAFMAFTVLIDVLLPIALMVLVMWFLIRLCTRIIVKHLYMQATR